MVPCNVCKAQILSLYKVSKDLLVALHTVYLVTISYHEAHEPSPLIRVSLTYGRWLKKLLKCCFVVNTNSICRLHFNLNTPLAVGVSALITIVYL